MSYVTLVLYDVVGQTYDVVGWQESRCGLSVEKTGDWKEAAQKGLLRLASVARLIGPDGK